MAVETLEEKKSVTPRRSNKAPSVKASVIAKRVQGQSIAAIARDVGISRPTVYAILDETDIDRMMKDGRLGVMQQVPEALDTLKVRLEKRSESAAIWLLDKCFENQQPTGKHLAGDLTLNQTLNVLLHSEGENPQNLNSPIIKQIESGEKDK